MAQEASSQAQTGGRIRVRQTFGGRWLRLGVYAVRVARGGFAVHEEGALSGAVE